MGEKVTTSVMPHVKSRTFVEEHVDQYDAFTVAWNGEEAIHVTFGRNSVSVKSTRFFKEDGKPGVEANEVEPVRTDVAAISMPLEAARDLAETLARMCANSDARRNKSE